MTEKIYPGPAAGDDGGTGVFFLRRREGSMGKRVGFIGVIIDERGKSVNEVNRVLSEVEDIVVARMGVPYKEKSCCVITLVVNATTDEMGALTGKLGEIQGVSIKSALSKM